MNRNFYAESSKNLIYSSSSTQNNQLSSTFVASRSSHSNQQSSVQVSSEKRHSFAKEDTRKSLHQDVENSSKNALSEQKRNSLIKEIYRKVSVAPAVHQTNQFNEEEQDKIRVRLNNVEDQSEDEEGWSLSQESQPVVSAISYPNMFEQPPPKPKRSIVPAIIVNHNYESSSQIVSESINESSNLSNNRSISQSNKQSNYQINNNSLNQTDNRLTSQSSNRSIAQSNKQSNYPINNHSISHSDNRSTSQSSNQSIAQSNNQSSNQSIVQSNNRSTSQSSNQSMAQSNNQSVIQSNNRSTSQSSNQSMAQSNNQSIIQSNNRSTSQSIKSNQSMAQSNNQSIIQSNNRSTSQSSNQLIAQSNNQSSNQSIIQSNNRSTGQSSSQSNNQLISQSNNHLVNHASNQLVSQSVNQRSAQSNNQSNSLITNQSLTQLGYQPINNLTMQPGFQLPKNQNLQSNFTSSQINNNLSHVDGSAQSSKYSNEKYESSKYSNEKYESLKHSNERYELSKNSNERYELSKNEYEGNKVSSGFQSLQKVEMPLQVVYQSPKALSNYQTAETVLENKHQSNKVATHRERVDIATEKTQILRNSLSNDQKTEMVLQKSQNLRQESANFPISNNSQKEQFMPQGGMHRVLISPTTVSYKNNEDFFQSDDQFKTFPRNHTKKQSYVNTDLESSTDKTNLKKHQNRKLSLFPKERTEVSEKVENVEQRKESRIRAESIQYEKRRESEIRNKDIVQAEKKLKNEKVMNDYQKSHSKNQKERLMEHHNEEFKRNYRNDDIIHHKNIIQQKEANQYNYNKQLVNNFRNESAQEPNYERQPKNSFANTKSYALNEQTSSEKVKESKNKIKNETNLHNYQLEIRESADANSSAEYLFQQHHNVQSSQINNSKASSSFENQSISYQNLDVSSLSVIEKEDNYYNYNKENIKTSKAAIDDRRFSIPNSILRQSEDSSSRSSFSEGMQSFEHNEYRRTSWNEESNSKNKKVNKQQLSVSFEEQQNISPQYITDFQEPFGSSNFEMSSEEVNKFEKNREYKKSKQVQKSHSLTEGKTRNQQLNSSSRNMQYTQNQLNQDVNAIKVLGGSHIESGSYMGNASHIVNRSHMGNESHIRNQSHTSVGLYSESENYRGSENYFKNFGSQFKTEIESGSDVGSVSHFSSTSNESKKKLNIKIQSIKKEKKKSQSSKSRARSSIQINLRNDDQDYHFGSVNVSEKNGIITLEMDENDNFIFNDSEDSEFEHQSSFNNEQNIYEENELSYRHHESSYRANHNRRKSEGDLLVQRKSIDYLNHSYEDLLDVHKDAEVETIYYTVCTKYFKPENEDWIANIHRMGNFNVLSGVNHLNNCVFWNNLFDRDNEEIVVQKIIPQENENGFSKIEITKQNNSVNFKNREMNSNIKKSKEHSEYRNKKTQKRKRFGLLKKPRDHEITPMFF
ncbi:putative uncharacterized protein DDB_G0282133 isoform X4 [Hydra vulgaris]|uniref:Uncharacterized protein n=1 Tax=Hydra vulgaris TaxID=6087 RepID=A0ABM4CFU4_HYDVU